MNIVNWSRFNVDGWKGKDKRHGTRNSNQLNYLYSHVKSDKTFTAYIERKREREKGENSSSLKTLELP